MSTTIFDEIPEILTNTGIAVYDTRREKTWVKELKGYFAENRPYTGDIFNYDRLWSAIESMAEDVAKEIINAAKAA
ncbi:unknown [Clostridium sp. CAG:921]|nr:unknown [Clostridium sp. CAG:921]